MKVRRTLLLVDDDRLLCRSIRDVWGAELDVLVAHSAQEALALCSQHPVDLAILDKQLPDGEGHTLCEPILQFHPQAKIIFITAFPSMEHAITALKAGAHDYLCKPFDLADLRLAMNRCLSMLALEKVERLHVWRTQKDRQDAVLVGGSAAMIEVRRLVHLAAASDVPVLITGETGTGKNLVARSIHGAGARRDAPFLPLNCSALPETLIEAELFGWERGAFTGAVAAREGVLELAEGGSLFLDEIGEMPVHLQSKLLSVLEDKEVKRLGGRILKTVHVRILAATNAELEQQIAQKRFRADLYYRLNVLRVHLPPLRERPEDVAPLCEHLLAGLTARSHPVVLDPAELERLAAYPWPGNVRELKNVLERALLLHGDEPRPSALLQASARPARFLAPPAAEAPPAPRRSTLRELESTHIEEALVANGNNRTRAAQALGISLSTLKRHLRAGAAGSK